MLASTEWPELPEIDQTFSYYDPKSVGIILILSSQPPERSYGSFVFSIRSPVAGISPITYDFSHDVCTTKIACNMT